MVTDSKLQLLTNVCDLSYLKSSPMDQGLTLGVDAAQSYHGHGQAPDVLVC